MKCLVGGWQIIACEKGGAIEPTGFRRADAEFLSRPLFP